MNILPDQKIDLFDMVLLTLYLGSLVFFTILIYQLILTYKQDGKLTLKALILVISTLLISLNFFLLIWSNWTDHFELMFVPILLPLLLIELIFFPIMFKFFKYKLTWKKANR